MGPGESAEMSFPIRQLEAFRAVALKGSITRAAEELAISQPAVSRLLSALSASVEFELFQRISGRLVPTREAEFLLREVERVLDNLGRIEQLTHDLSTRKAGHLRIACLPGFATSHLPKVLADFLSGRPNVTAVLEPDRPERILEWIIGEQYDCGITDEFAGHPTVESTTVLMRTVCILPRGHALAAKAEIWPSDLAQERIVHTRRDSGFYQRLSEAFALRNLRLGSHVETRQFTAACMLVAAGAGVSVVSEMDAREYEHRGLLIRPFRPDVPHRLSLLRPSNARASLLALEFLDTFEKSLEPFRFR